GVWKTGMPFSVAAVSLIKTGSPRQHPIIAMRHVSRTSECTRSASTISTSAPSSAMCFANAAPSNQMWFRAFQSSCTTSMWRSRRAVAAGSKDAVMRARMRPFRSRPSGRQQRLDEAHEMTLDLGAERRLHGAATEKAPVGRAVEHVEDQDRVRREHPQPEVRLGEAAATLP